MTAHRRLWFLAPLVLLLGVFGQGTAHAAGTCFPATPDHCYAVASFEQPGPTYGINLAQAQLITNCITMPSYTNDRLNNTLWLLSETISTSSPTYWIEAGLVVGHVYSGQVFSTPRLYWADYRPNGTYNEHYGSAYTLDTAVIAKIEKALVAGSWNVSIGSLSGTSTSNFATAGHRAETGIETTEDAGVTVGTNRYLKFKTQGNFLVDGWRNGPMHADPVEDPVTSFLAVTYEDPDNKYRHYRTTEGGGCP